MNYELLLCSNIDTSSGNMGTGELVDEGKYKHLFQIS